jgi:hypothetical protein
LFDIAVALVAVLAGGIASVAGFGIGSLLTPLVASQYSMKTALSATAIPHVIATVLRFSRASAGMWIGGFCWASASSMPADHLPARWSRESADYITGTPGQQHRKPQKGDFRGPLPWSSH